jgi:hypothetical protein
VALLVLVVVLLPARPTLMDVRASHHRCKEVLLVLVGVGVVPAQEAAALAQEGVVPLREVVVLEVAVLLVRHLEEDHVLGR